MKAHKIIKSVLALSLAVIAVSSCQEKMKGFGFSKGEVVKFSVGTEGSSLDTKAAYSGDGTTTVERIDWEKGDMIRIYCAEVSEPENKYADYMVTSVVPPASGATASTAHIEGTGGVGLRWGEGNHYFYGIAPAANIAKGSESPNHVIATGNVSASQTPGTPLTADISVAAGETFKVDADMTNMFMAAKAGPYSETGKKADENGIFLSFTPLTTAIEFTITNDTGADMELSSVSLISGNGKSSAPVINGNFSIDLDSWATPADAKPADGSMTVTYGRAYPACTGVATSTSMDDRTLIINFGKEITLAAKSGETKGGSLTFTFLLTPTHDFEDLTFKFTKSDDSWMSTRLGYTDGSGVFFPHFKKTTVKGIMLPEGVQWTVKYAPTVDPWGPGGGDIKPTPEVSGNPFVTSWNVGIKDEPLELKPENNLLPGQFSINETEYVRFSRGNLFCKDNGSSASPRFTFDLEKNQYSFHTRYGLAHEGIPFPAEVPGIIYKENESGFFQWVSENAAVKSSDVSKFNDARACFGAFSELEYEACTGLPTDVVDFGKAYGDGMTWTILTELQFKYLISSRPNASNLCETSVTVNGVKGMVIAPDNWNYTSSPIASSYEGEAWTKAEAQGLVFLPSAGYFKNNSSDPKQVSSCSTYGNYWSKTADSSVEMNAYYMYFTSGEVDTFANKRSNGLSVRLVQKFFKPHDAVKIGNVYWATTNIGADTPKDYGWYFFWGGTEGYVYDSTNKKWVKASDHTSMLSGGFDWVKTPYQTQITTDAASTKFTKYLGYKDSSFRDPSATDDDAVKTVLDPEDDAARVNWGGSWRMPTSAEFQTMMDATYWAWDSEDKGYYVFFPDETHTAGTSVSSIPDELNKDNALLFFPAAGFGSSAGPTNAGSGGYYRSSSLLSSNPYISPSLFFLISMHSPQLFNFHRCDGQSIRPVHD